MSDLAKRLPPLTALLTFEAAARHQNFTRAAAELGRTQSAVSRQISSLEAWLGVSLFHRDRRTVRLTDPGQALFSATTLGFEHIARAAAEMPGAAAQASDTVTIASSPALTTFWLIPRLTDYSHHNPDADIRVVVVSLPLNDPEARDADLLFVWGDGVWPGLDCRLLTRDEVLTVQSPAYTRRGPIASLDDLTHERLLHLDAPKQVSGPWHGWLDWPAFYREMGAEGSPNLARGLHLNSFTHLIQACLAGEGIALAWRMVVDDHLKSGALVPVLDDRLALDNGYYLAWPSDRPASPATVDFRDWLLDRNGGAGAEAAESGTVR